MPIDRRDFLVMGAAAGIAGALKRMDAAQPRAAADLYDHLVVIDGCGAPGDNSTDADHPLSAAGFQDAIDSGVTGINLTVGPVGLASDSAASPRHKSISPLAYFPARPGKMEVGI